MLLDIFNNCTKQNHHPKKIKIKIKNYLLAIHPFPEDSHDAPFITLSIASITRSPSSPRSKGASSSSRNSTFTIISSPPKQPRNFSLYKNVNSKIYLET